MNAEHTTKGGKTPADQADAMAHRRAADVLSFVSRKVAGNLVLGEVLRDAMTATAQAMGAEACSILLQDAKTGELFFRLVEGEHIGGLQSARVPANEQSISGWVAVHGVTLLVPDAYEDSRFDRSYDTRTGFRTRSVICVPLKAKEHQLGVMQLLNRRDGCPFDAQDAELAEAVAAMIAMAVHNAEEHEARLKAEREAAVGRAVAGLAHCVKNILNGLQGGSYIVEQNLARGDYDAVNRGWQMVGRNMRLLSDIVLDMLSYSKDRKPICQPCRTDDLCRDVIALLQPLANEKRMTLVSNLEPGLPEVRLDEQAIKRCLINLMGNAIDACSDTSGVVTIEVTRVSDRVVALSVADNGCGMPREVMEKIFDPFFSTKGNKGTGLGLAVTRKLVKEHGGRLTVESAPNQGTRFTIELHVDGPPA